MTCRAGTDAVLRELKIGALPLMKEIFQNQKILGYLYFLIKLQKPLDLELTPRSKMTLNIGREKRKMKKLVIYYSQANGNTKRIAEMIASKTGADITAIDTVAPYTGTYDEIVNQGQEEVNRGFQPEIKDIDVNPAEYDEIIIGTPTWWYTMAPAVLTFLSNSDFSGKKVAVFQTHGGWPGHTLKDMKALLKNSEIISEKAIQFDSTGGDHLETSPEEIENWIRSL
jgi:flavodoxin